MTPSRADAATERVASAALRLTELRERLRRIDLGEPATAADVRRARQQAVVQAQACVAARERLVATHQSAAARHEEAAHLMAAVGLDRMAHHHEEAARHEIEAAAVATEISRQEQDVLAEARRVAAGTDLVDGSSESARHPVIRQRLQLENTRLRDAVAAWMTWSGGQGGGQDDRRRRLSEAVVTRCRGADWHGWAHAVCVVASTHFPFVRGAAITAYTADRSPELMAASDGWASRVEEMQHLVGEGPSVTAHQQRTAVLVSDLDTESERWPGFAGAIAGTAVHALWSLPVAVSGDSVATLTLYHYPRARPNADSWSEAQMLADAAAAALLADVDGLQRGQTTGAGPYLLYIASGVLSTRLKVTTDEASARLRAHAFSSGLNLSDVAAAVIDGQLDLT